MSTHLSRDVLIELAEAEALRAEQRRAETVHGHMAVCGQCRRAFEDARAALLLARDVEIPEPSPLFWDHFSARVRDAVASGEAAHDARRAGVVPGGWRAVIVSACVVLVLVAIAFWRLGSGHGTAGGTASSARTAAVTPISEQAGRVAAEPLAGPGESTDATWRLMSDAASNADLDTTIRAGGFALQPGAAERAVLQMSPDEQREVVRLLRAEVERGEAGRTTGAVRQ